MDTHKTELTYTIRDARRLYGISDFTTCVVYGKQNMCVWPDDTIIKFYINSSVLVVLTEMHLHFIEHINKYQAIFKNIYIVDTLYRRRSRIHIHNPDKANKLFVKSDAEIAV